MQIDPVHPQRLWKKNRKGTRTIQIHAMDGWIHSTKR